MKKLLCLMAGVMLIVVGRCQNIETIGQPFISGKLYIDSRLPDVSLGTFIRHKRQNAKLSDFKNKIIILDFWFTHCTDCIKQFPKEDSLQREFGADIQIIPVTYESKETVTKFLDNWEKQHNIELSLPFIVADTLLNKCFANAYFPHYVWLAPDRRIIGETSQHFLTKNNIKGLIEEMHDLKMKVSKDEHYFDNIPQMKISDLYDYRHNQ